MCTCSLLFDMFSYLFNILLEYMRDILQLTKQSGNIVPNITTLKGGRMGRLWSNDSHMNKITQFHKYLKQADGPKVNELQVIFI